MAYIIKMPKVGMEMQEGILIEWFIDEGEEIREGEPIAEIESEKSTMTIDAHENGVLRRTFIGPGTTVEPGTALGILAEADESIDELLDLVEGSSEEEQPKADTPSETKPVETSSQRLGSMKVSPRAKKRAAELDVDLDSLSMSGITEPVTADDVEAAMEQQSTTVETDGRTIVEERELTGMRETISQRLGESYRNAIHVTEHREVDAEELLAARDAINQEHGIDASVMDLLLIALSETLGSYPEFNAIFEDGIHRIIDEQNIGIAIDVDQGLLTPVIQDIQEMSVDELASAREELTARTLAGNHTHEDLQGGTFTVTNLGPFGVESFTPIINPPQIAILGVNALVEQPVAVDGNMEIRNRLPIDLAFDHRAVDGADAARFLSTLADHIENPWPLLEISASSKPEVADKIVLPERTVSADTDGGLQGTVSAGSFEWEFDEPTKLGGSGSAPTPVDIFLGALSACMSASIGFQANKRDVDLRGVTIDVDGAPAHGSLESIDISVTLEVDQSVDEDTLDRIVQLGERGCHVSNLIHDECDVNVTWQRK